MGKRKRRRLVVIGGDAAGMSAASQARRLDSELDIVALERGRWTSYSACGIPYLVGGEVADLDDLVARDPHTFRTQHNIDARTRHEAVSVDVDKHKVKVRDHEHGGRTYTLAYDVLHLATGAVPIRPDMPGIDDPAVHGVQTMEDAAHLLAHAEKLGPSCRVVVVGGGYIGLEMAEAFTRRGSRTTVITRSPQPLPLLDADMGSRVADAMRCLGVELVTGSGVEGFDGGRVRTDAGDVFDADLVVLGLGVAPNSVLAGEAGLTLADDGTIDVDRRQQTSSENVFAAGDCCASFHLVTGRRTHVALGTVANKQGRVAGTNIGGGYAAFPGVVGTAVTKVCDLECARTGLNEEEAAGAGFSFVSATVEGTTRAGYFPGAAPVAVKMLAERGSGRVLGAQIVGNEGSAKRIDVVATAITMAMDVEAVSMLDLGYAPPFGPLWDPVLLAARKLADGV